MQKYNYIAIILFSLLSGLSNGQNLLEFKQLSGDNVTTQSITYAIAQDSIGIVWIASEEGVFKYDSNSLINYTTHNGLPEELNNRTTAIFIDKSQRVWAGFENGIAFFNPNRDVFELVSQPQSINPSLITSFSEDLKGNLWIGGFNGLWRFNRKNGLKRIANNQGVQTLLAFGNNIYFGTKKGLYLFNVETDEVKMLTESLLHQDITALGFIDNTIHFGTASGHIYRIGDDNFISKFQFNDNLNVPIKDLLQDADKNIYVATDGFGLLKASKNLPYGFKSFQEDIDDPKTITSNGIYDIELGLEDILWVATYGGGVNYASLNQLPFQKIRHVLNEKNSLVTNFTRAIAEDENGNLWFGTKKGLSIWNPETNIWKHLKSLSSYSNSSDIVLALEAIGSKMWVGTFNNGLHQVDINTLQTTKFDIPEDSRMVRKIYALKKDSSDHLWVGGIEGQTAIIYPNGEVKTLPIQQTKSFIETNDGQDIISVGRTGVYSIKINTHEFKNIEDLNANEQKLAYSNLNGVYEMANGTLVLATNGAGLVFYNPQTKDISTLDLAKDFPSDIVQGIIAKSDSELWVSTTKGLVQVELKENDTIFSTFDERDGLASTEYNYGSYVKLANGDFLFGGINGVTRFNPDNIMHQERKPRLVFEKFKLFNKVVTPNEAPLEKHINETDFLTLKHNQNSVEFEFAGILHSSPTKVKYSWILEGFEDSWSAPTTSNFATYTNLNPGKYTFKVKASNKYGEFGEMRNIVVNIASPWWATWKAYVLYILLALTLLYLIIHFTGVILKKRNADEQIAFYNNITHEIKTPLSVLLSSLDNVTEEVDAQKSKKRIKTTVKRINSLFEQMLNFHKITSQKHINQDIGEIDLGHHIQKIKEYFEPLTLERNLAIRINNQWTAGAFHHDVEVLDKVIYNLLSNAIKYSHDGGHILINLSKTTLGKLKVEIRDEGIGIPEDQQKHILTRYYRARNVINSQRAGTGLGLVMVNTLLEKTGGTISFVSEENKGTTFTVLLNNLKNEYVKLSKSRAEKVKEFKYSPDELQELESFSESKVLVVEDNDELRDAMEKSLGRYFQVFHSNNGKEGLEKASTVYPDLILTDLIMPEMDGMQMAKQLKDDINLNHIPVFMLTVLQNSAQKLESIESGITEYIEKPVDMNLLMAKIINTLKYQKTLQQKYKQEGDADMAKLFKNKKDRKFIKKLEKNVIKHITDESFSVHDLSNNFGMSRTSLYMKLKNLVDMSPQDFIIHTKLKFAKKLLIETDYSIKEVAYSSGFSNPKYFSTSFKKFYGTTPTGFLESLKDS